MELIAMSPKESAMGTRVLRKVSEMNVTTKPSPVKLVRYRSPEDRKNRELSISYRIWVGVDLHILENYHTANFWKKFPLFK